MQRRGGRVKLVSSTAHYCASSSAAVSGRSEVIIARSHNIALSALELGHFAIKKRLLLFIQGATKVLLSLVDSLQLTFKLLHFRYLGTLRILALRFLAVRATGRGLP